MIYVKKHGTILMNEYYSITSYFLIKLIIVKLLF